MKKTEKRKVEVEKEVLTEVTCDICKKEINIQEFHFEAETGHDDWGNDSYESIENKDLCSDECLMKEFKKYLDSDDKTKYINIRRVKYDTTK